MINMRSTSPPRRRHARAAPSGFMAYYTENYHKLSEEYYKEYKTTANVTCISKIAAKKYAELDHNEKMRYSNDIYFFKEENKNDKSKVKELPTAKVPIAKDEPAKVPKDEPAKVPKDEPAPTAKVPKDEPAPTAKVPKDEPAPTAKVPKDEPAPTAKVPKDEPAPTAKVPKDEPAPTAKVPKDEPAPTAKVPKDEPAPTAKEKEAHTLKEPIPKDLSCKKQPDEQPDEQPDDKPNEPNEPNEQPDEHTKNNDALGVKYDKKDKVKSVKFDDFDIEGFTFL
jgi:hypothetical protein